MVALEDTPIPPEFREDVERAVGILRDAGCTAVFVFGSVATGRVREWSDLDLAVRGCPPSDFFKVLGKLLMTLDHSVDLVDLDCADPFVEHLQTYEELVRVA
jgi:predicted nucleotidyltransferase